MKNKNLLILLLTLIPNLALGAASKLVKPEAAFFAQFGATEAPSHEDEENSFAPKQPKVKRAKKAAPTDITITSDKTLSSSDATVATKPAIEKPAFANNEELLRWVCTGRTIAVAAKDDDKSKHKQALLIEDVKTLTAVLLGNALWQEIGQAPLLAGGDFDKIKNLVSHQRRSRIETLTNSEKIGLLLYLCTADGGEGIVSKLLSTRDIIAKAGTAAPETLMSAKDQDLRLKACKDPKIPAIDPKTTPPRKIVAKAGATPSKKRGLHSRVAAAPADTPRLATHPSVKAAIAEAVSAVTSSDGHVELESTLPKEEWENIAAWAYSSAEPKQAIIQKICIEKRVVSKIAPITQFDPGLEKGQLLNQAHLISMPEVFEAIRAGTYLARTSTRRDRIKIEISCVIPVQRTIKGSSVAAHTEADAPEAQILVSPKGSPLAGPQELELIFGNTEETNCSPCTLYHAFQQPAGHAASNERALGQIKEEDGAWILDDENKLVFLFSDSGIEKFKSVLEVKTGTQQAIDGLQTFIGRARPGAATPGSAKKPARPKKDKVFFPCSLDAGKGTARAAAGGGDVEDDEDEE